jgi:hypothetical protein
VYLPRYLTQDDPFWSLSPQAVRERFLAALQRMYPPFSPDDVLAFEISRVRDMLALTTLDYSARARPPIRTSLPNVHIVNSAEIANGTLNVNETVAVANDGAERLRAVLARRRPRMNVVEN